MKKAKMKSASVFLVSGGAKGITAQCVLKLAQQQQCKFILLGRSAIVATEPDWAKDCVDESELKKRIMDSLLSQGEKPTPKTVQTLFNAVASSREIKKTLSAIAQAGSQAEYLSVDVTDSSALQAQLAPVVARLGAVTGMIHGAGNLADKLIEKKSLQDFETVYAAKVKGLENLLACVPPSQLRHLVLFSSVSGFYGNSGQADYAIANEILNKSAYLVKQHHPNCHVVAINWGPWDSGMVSQELKQAFAQRQIETIPLAVGADMLVDELDDANHNTVQVVVGSPLTPPVNGLDTEFQTHRIRRQLTLAANPFLQDHVIAGYPVLPAACALSWMINTCEQLYPGYKFFSCADFKVLKGIVFDQALANQYTLELKEVTKVSHSTVEFAAKIWSKNPAEKIPHLYHYTAQIKLLKEIPVAPTYDLNLTRDQVIPDEQPLYRSGEASLFHGPCFQGIQAVLNMTREKITTQCTWLHIDERRQGQFPIQNVNPYIADIMMHPQWVLLQHFYQDKHLPSSLQKLEYFAAVPFGETFYVSCEIKSKTESSVVVDLIAHDCQGQIYSRVLGGRGTIFPRDERGVDARARVS